MMNLARLLGTAALALAVAPLAQRTARGPPNAPARPLPPVRVPPPRRVAPPAAERLGFINRPSETPVVALRQYGPFPECFIFLEGGRAAPDAAAPPKSAVVWQLDSNSFSPPLLPVVSGSTVEIDNVSRAETHLLVAPGKPDVLPADPIGPGGTKTISAAGDAAIIIESRSSPHLKGRLVPLPSRYFAKLDRNGRFKIENVPAGRWTIKLWYRDGWANLPGRSVDVPGKDMKIELPNDAFAVGK